MADDDPPRVNPYQEQIDRMGRAIPRVTKLLSDQAEYLKQEGQKAMKLCDSLAEAEKERDGLRERVDILKDDKAGHEQDKEALQRMFHNAGTGSSAVAAEMNGLQQENARMSQQYTSDMNQLRQENARMSRMCTAEFKKNARYEAFISRSRVFSLSTLSGDNY